MLRTTHAAIRWYAIAILAPALWATLPAAQASPGCSHLRPADPGYRRQAMTMVTRLGTPPGYVRSHEWTVQPEAPALVWAGRDVYGRPLRLAPDAARALGAMVAAAARDGVTLQTVSGFRSVARQRRLVRRKLDRGVPLASVLRVNALPGFSEHHSGCALDLTTPGAAAADPSFATTRAFEWLQAHAGAYGFGLSYPPDNRHGIDFEPWHWRYRGAPAALAGEPPRSPGTSPSSIASIATDTPEPTGDSTHVP